MVARSGAAHKKGERLTEASTFSMLAAAWGGGEYREVHVDPSASACDCHVPAMARPHEHSWYGAWAHCSSHHVRRRRRRARGRRR